MAALKELVAGTRHIGAACQELDRFRAACITGSTLPQQVLRSLKLTLVLQLYIAAYCRPNVTKDLWNYIVSGLSDGTPSYMQVASGEAEARVSRFVKVPHLHTTEPPNW